MTTDDLGVPEALDLCAWCLEPVHPPAQRTCPALDLTMLIERSAMVHSGELGPSEPDRASTPPVATQAEHFLWSLAEHDPDELSPPF